MGELFCQMAERRACGIVWYWAWLPIIQFGGGSAGDDGNLVVALAEGAGQRLNVSPAAAGERGGEG